MPGIVGIISKGRREVHEHNIALMLERMSHERFYTSGAYANMQLGVYVGWVSHKRSFSDCMPIYNNTKDLVLFFNGEHFADGWASSLLAGRSDSLVSTNAGYLINLYEKEREEFFGQLNGWFSGLIIDLKREEVILFNDRYGMARIYYYETKDELLFSSEAKSLLRIRQELREIDLDGLSELITYGCTLEHKTLFKNVSLLPGGSAWKFYKDGACNKRTYFSCADWENQSTLDTQDFCSKLEETCRSIMPRYLQSHQGIGMSLTGGLDTRAILACSQVVPGSMPCYTFGGMGRDTFDVKVAQKVAAECGQTHEVLRLDSKFFAEFPSIVEKTIFVSDGYWDVCGAHEIYLNALARDVAPIRLTGNYGSEVLRSIKNFRASPPDEQLLSADFATHVRQAQETFNATSNMNKISFALFKEIPWRLHGSLVAAQSQLTVRSPYMDNDLVRLVYQAPGSALVGNEVMLRLIADNSRILGQIQNDMGDGTTGFPLMAVGTRLLRKFLFKIEWYYSAGMPHWMMKANNAIRWADPERMFLGWHRYLFYRLWFQSELSGYVKQILFDRRTNERSFWKKDYLEQIVTRHLSGAGNYTNEINKVLTIELIHRLFIEKP